MNHQSSRDFMLAKSTCSLPPIDSPRNVSSADNFLVVVVVVVVVVLKIMNIMILTAVIHDVLSIIFL
jgi:hypothetical protein